VIILRLPWPDRKLSPNARVHWAAKAKAVKLARETACVMTLCEMTKGARMTANELHLKFCPPDRRRRDLDNMIASSKAYIDGICDAIGIDDSQLSLRISRGEPTKGGEVIAAITRGEQA
jgi:crossover junction endodeoxyribonuclease RusA